ncbi:MAG: L-aspartate oxidase [Desulfobulbaceae bacterium]|nr:L-aspartate oxidase [Desulfobulbaceae bacterium]
MFTTDVLIIGSGIAGLSLAMKVADFSRVTVVTKKARVDTATNLAQGGIAAVLSDSDSLDSHVRDTLRSGDGLCDERIVRMVVEEGPERVLELMEMGVRFQAGSDGKGLDLGMEGGHSCRRVAHSLDLTGREIERALIEQVEKHGSIEVLEDHLAIDLLVQSKVGAGDKGEERCLGAYVLNRTTGGVEVRQAKVTVLCTGGCGKVYLYTTNPDIATGDGVAMAFRAGARVANLEFVQFHPTCFYNPLAKNFLISEAVRGEGGELVNEQGVAFMQKYDSRGDLATRDAVARGIDAEMKESGADCVYLDLTHRQADFIRDRFPTIYSTCKRYGVDITREPIPVVPAAHYMCGGVQVDEWGQTSIKSLFSLGETASTGLHGANRLASNSLLEAVVFAHRAGIWLKKNWPDISRLPYQEIRGWRVGQARSIEENVLISHNWDQIRRLMWNYVGIVRREKRLQLVRRRIQPIFQEIREHFHDFLLTPDLVELRNIAVVAELIIRSAEYRKESRGLHYMVDYPTHDDARFKRDTVFTRDEQWEKM